MTTTPPDGPDEIPPLPDENPGPDGPGTAVPDGEPGLPDCTPDPGPIVPSSPGETDPSTIDPSGHAGG